MKILHYALGFQKYGGGGLTKYCMDLMTEQKRQGDEVFMLWPGRMKKKAEVRIVKRKNEAGFGSFELVNPMPVALLRGIKEIEPFICPTDKSVYVSFFKENHFDVIHLHTLMGLPKEFLEAAKELYIKSVFTSHDFFGLCPRVNLLYHGSCCAYDKNCTGCAECNRNAISLDKIRMQQSGLYRTLKKSRILNKLKKYHNKPLQMPEKDTDITKTDNSEKSKRYVTLRNYYLEMFHLVTKLHFNSTTTEKIYRDFQVNTYGKTISITHGDITDARKKREYGDKIRLGYLGPASYRKGFFVLKEVLDSLQDSYKDRFELHLYSRNQSECDYIVEHKPYDYSEMPQVMDSIDMLVLPSICRETFGFTVLEALSYGVPVMINKNVGARDLVEDYKSGIIFEATPEDMKVKLQEVLDRGPGMLQDMNAYICDRQNIKTMEIHAKEMREFYQH